MGLRAWLKADGVRGTLLKFDPLSRDFPVDRTRLRVVTLALLLLAAILAAWVVLAVPQLPRVTRSDKLTCIVLEHMLEPRQPYPKGPWAADEIVQTVTLRSWTWWFFPVDWSFEIRAAGPDFFSVDGKRPIIYTDFGDMTVVTAQDGLRYVYHRPTGTWTSNTTESYRQLRQHGRLESGPDANAVPPAQAKGASDVEREE